MTSRPTEEDRIEGLAECLADALELAGLYEVETDRDFARMVGILQRMISGLRCFSWSTDPQNPSMTVEVAELWITRAIERALLDCGSAEKNIRVSMTTAQ